jgi:hypothetical protein
MVENSFCDDDDDDDDDTANKGLSFLKLVGQIIGIQNVRYP